MARKSKRSSRRTHRTKRVRRHYGGVAPVGYSDQGWASRVSFGQGGDYLRHHAGQHGGASLAGAPLGSESSLIPSNMYDSAGQSGIYRALSEISGMRDQAGGRRRRSKKATSKKGKKAKSKSKSKKRHARRTKQKARRTHRRRGGALNPSPYPSGGHLLSMADEAKAGHSGEWNGIEVAAARERASF